MRTQAYNFVTRVSTVYALLAACKPGDPPRVVPWREWAPDARVFHTKPSDDTLVSGTRCAKKVWPTTLRRKWGFLARDFCPSVTQVVGDGGEDRGLVTDGSRLRIPALWDTPIDAGARLPFRNIKYVVEGSPGDSAYLGEDYLVILEDNKCVIARVPEQLTDLLYPGSAFIPSKANLKV